ncbi:hypothetical protein HOLleu_15785 [Holothuria leucospilota]|uniref:Uncharacterized protein n=1 Tax=Holothuria leucospilota TaxID=206669 RepID=A0A9Q1C5P5_HOLLE|nr:hypothetical protein HOLleu_15785 [Holothuria leucospilota]
MFYPFLDHLLCELETRLVYPIDRFSAQYLVPSNLHKLNPEIEANLFVPFASDIPDEMASLQEREHWSVSKHIRCTDSATNHANIFVNKGLSAQYAESKTTWFYNE